MQVPPVTVWAVDPDTVHTCGVSELNDTMSDESGAADADRLTGTPTVASAGGAKVMICAACPAVTWNDRATSGAAA